MKRNWIILLIIAALAALGLWLWKRTRDTELVCYRLPKSSNPEVFGPYYWRAFHDLAARIPCPGCRGFAEKFMTFFHDNVNKKLGKPLHDPENFNYFIALYKNTELQA